ncbi:hypothetical protein OPT61_g2306 [Boeremia exigua]|uniref:Uncharacterized protein n=1 Tax=Boeremia exigua TaxID=749465 RepID=A0ACC2IME9_9PLEO|nr:hypothetical protein OPT61_g2306 [Boeremia exigua]
MVDVENHEDSLRELSKTSLVNNVTIMLCWSAQEAGRYLELFKTFEHAAPTSIRAKQSSTYSENMVEFITVPRGINKTDARWCNAVKEPFRVKKAAKRGMTREGTQADLSRDTSMAGGENHMPAEPDVQTTARRKLDEAVPVAIGMQQDTPIISADNDADRRPDHRPAEVLDEYEDDEAALRDVDHPAAPVKRKRAEEEISDGVMAALKVQIEIFSYLQGLSLKAVRGVCRAFRDNAEPTLFRGVIATARYQSLGALQKISLFPVFQKHVREIVFDGSVYDPLLAKYESQYHRQAAQLPDLEQGFSYHKHARWKRYAQLFKEQEEMKSDGVLVQTISRALEWMPNIACIIYSPHPHHLPAEIKETKDLVPRGITTSPATTYTSAEHPFRQLIAALYISQFTGIREFRAEYLGAKPGTEFALSIFDLGDDEMAAAKFLFQGLEKLSLNMALWVPNENIFGEVLDKFATLLRISTDLQHLHFRPTHWKSEMGARPLFARLGLHATWSKLQSLSLHNVLADECEISDIIKRHKETLTSIKFSRCSLLVGAWADVVDEVVYGTNILPFVLERVNERGLPSPQYSSLSPSEKELWKYEGYIAVTQDGDRNFVEDNPAKKIPIRVAGDSTPRALMEAFRERLYTEHFGGPTAIWRHIDPARPRVMVDHSHSSHFCASESSVKDSPSHAYPSTSPVRFDAAYHVYTASVTQHNPTAYAHAHQTPFSNQSTYGASESTQHERRDEQQHHPVPRPSTYSNPSITRTLNDPALEHETTHNHSAHQTYTYNIHAPYTHHPSPETSSSSHGPSKRFTTSNLQSHEHQTTPSTSMETWRREHPRDSPWNAVGEVGKASEYEPFKRKL